MASVLGVPVPSVSELLLWGKQAAVLLVALWEALYSKKITFLTIASESLAPTNSHVSELGKRSVSN